MRIQEITHARIPEIKIISFARFCDNRGYFTEPMRKSDFVAAGLCSTSVEWVQINESFSKQSTIRGLHFQWNPYMGKLVRTISGHMVDLILDIRKDSPTFGKIIAYDMPENKNKATDEWIWIPPGFAHGNFFLEDTKIEYLCTGEYRKECEACISPLAPDIDWSLCDRLLKNQFDSIVSSSPIITDKDREGLGMQQWAHDDRISFFFYRPFAK